MHILLDVGAAHGALGEAASRTVELAIQAAVASEGRMRLTLLYRAGAPLARSGAADAPSPATLSPLVVALMTAPARDAARPARDGQRLAALVAEVGADLLVTWNLPDTALASMASGTRALLLGEPGPPQLHAVEVATASWPRSVVEAREWFEHAAATSTSTSTSASTGAPVSPQRQARIQAGILSSLCDDARVRESGSHSQPRGAPGAGAPKGRACVAGIDDRNALVFVLGPRALYRENFVSTREIVCGPDMATTFVNGRLATLNVPAGAHDARRLIEWLPADQRPELVLVKADGTGRNLPSGLAAVSCPKVLLVGDTHHLDAPLRRVMGYARSEPFDFVAIDHTRHHGHYFVEAGFEKVAWLPAFDISPHDVPSALRVPPDGGAAAIASDPSVVFVGQVGALHPYRAHVLDALTKAGLPLRALRASPAEAARLYAQARVSLNVSLNGDVNLRVFEVMAAGGCLLTDALSADSGLETLFRDGEHLALYRDDASLAERARALLDSPEEAARIASAGHALYEREHAPAARIGTLTRWIDGGRLDDRWDLRADRRGHSLRSVDAADLNVRLAAYETVQEWHRVHGGSGTSLGLAVWPDVDARLLADLVDLPRLRLAVFGASTDIDPIARRVLVDAGAWERLRFVDEGDLGVVADGATENSGNAEGAPPSRRERFEGLLLSTRAWMDAAPARLARLARGRRILVAARGDVETHQVLGRQSAFAAEGYLAEAAAAIPSFQQKNPVVLGEIAAEEGRLEDALHHFQSALAADPEYVEALNNLGVLALHAGDPESAAAYLERAIGLDRSHVSALANLAAIREATGRPLEAESLLLSALAATAPDRLLSSSESAGAGDADLWQQLGQLRHQRGDHRGARAALLRAAAADRQRAPRLEAPGEAGVDGPTRSVVSPDGAHARVAPAPPLEPAPSAASDASPQPGAGGGDRAPGVSVQPVNGPPLRVLVLNNLYPPQELGGYGRLMADFASYLSEAGHRVHVLTSDTAYLGAIREPEAGITRMLQLFGGWKNGRTEELPKEAAIACARDNHLVLRGVVDAFRPDVAFVGNIDFVAPNIFVPLLERGIPVVHYLANGSPGYAPPDSPRGPLYRPIACSDWLARRLASTHPRLEGIGVIHPGARVDDYTMPVAPMRRRLRIAYASLVMPYKGAHVLMAALEELARRRVDFTAVIAGHSTDPTFLAELAERARGPSLRGRVKFPGFLARPQLRSLFARSNVLVFPSVFEEPFGISQVEAMAAGLTVVTSGTGGAREIIEHERSGLVFDSEDGARLADALASLPADLGRWERLAEGGRARALEHFDMRKLSRRLEAELRTLAVTATAATPASSGKAGAGNRGGSPAAPSNPATDENHLANAGEPAPRAGRARGTRLPVI